MYTGADLVLQGILTVAVIMDIKSDRIPNLCIVAGLLCGLAVSLGFQDVFWPQILLRVFLPILICFPLFCMGALGAGDIKLFSVIGSFWPMEQLLTCMV